MTIKIKKLDPNAIIPTYAKPGDAAMDVTAIDINITPDYIEYSTGLAFEIPEDHIMLIFPRSSNSNKDLLLANSVGVLDSGYRGELKLRFKLVYREGVTGRRMYANKFYNVGDRVGQILIIPRPKIDFIEVDELSETERGEGGFGSTN